MAPRADLAVLAREAREGGALLARVGQVRDEVAELAELGDELVLVRAEVPGPAPLVVERGPQRVAFRAEPLGADALALASEEVRMRGFTTRALEVRKIVAHAGVTITINGDEMVASPTEPAGRPGFEICSCFA